MKITILNGNPNAGNVTFDNYLKELSDLLESSRHTVTILKYRLLGLLGKNAWGMYSERWFA